MKKYQLLLVPFFIGLLLFFSSWYDSYPLNITSVDSSIFNFIPLTYWIGFTLLMSTFFLLSITIKNVYIKWILAICCVLTLYSLSFFYYTLPGSDAHYFRGLSLNFINTQNLDASQFIHSYYQWPAFFILSDMVSELSGLNYTAYAFLLFGLIGFLLASAIYIYGSSFSKQSAYVTVLSFFLMLFYFFNFQAVPFSLAFVLFLLLFVLQIHPKREAPATTILTIVLFISMSITHAFVPLFFLLYLFIVCILKKSKWHLELFIVTTIIYFLVQVTFGHFYWADNITKIFTTQNEFGSIADQTLVSAQPIFADVIAQTFSRIVTVGFAAISGIGFLFIFFQKKLTVESKAMFLSGIVYLALGFVLYTLGSRAIALMFLPIALGSVYLMTTKYKRLFKALIFILVILFVFVPIHASLNSYPVTFQTEEAAIASNFMIDHYSWDIPSTILTDNGIKWYIAPQVSTTTQIDASLDPSVSVSNLDSYSAVIYSVDFAHDLVSENMSQSSLLSEVYDNYDVLYSSGSTIIGLKK